jgi:hypothetical protein
MARGWGGEVHTVHWWRKLRERYHFADVGVYGRILPPSGNPIAGNKYHISVLKCILKIWVGGRRLD